MPDFQRYRCVCLLVSLKGFFIYFIYSTNSKPFYEFVNAEFYVTESTLVTVNNSIFSSLPLNVFSPIEITL